MLNMNFLMDSWMKQYMLNNLMNSLIMVYQIMSTSLRRHYMDWNKLQELIMNVSLNFSPNGYIIGGNYKAMFVKK